MPPLVKVDNVFELKQDVARSKKTKQSTWCCIVKLKSFHCLLRQLCCFNNIWEILCCHLAEMTPTLIIFGVGIVLGPAFFTLLAHPSNN